MAERAAELAGLWLTQRVRKQTMGHDVLWIFPATTIALKSATTMLAAIPDV
jgi:hypothetical protein